MKRIILLFVLLASPVYAQSQLSAADRIAMQIGSLVIQTQQQQDQIAGLQDQLAKANAKIKELEARKVEDK